MNPTEPRTADAIWTDAVAAYIAGNLTVAQICRIAGLLRKPTPQIATWLAPGLTPVDEEGGH